MWYNFPHFQCWQKVSIPETCKWWISHSDLCKDFSAPKSSIQCHRGPWEQGNGSSVRWQEYRITCLFALEPFDQGIVSAESFVTPEHLASTKPSTKYHSFRVYYQIMVWTGQAGHMKAVDWGWKLEDNQLVTVIPTKLLCQKAPYRWSTGTAKLAAEHTVVAEDTDYHAHQLVANVKLKTVIIT